MPRVNLYRGNAVQREGMTNARLVAADFRASPLGEGLQQAGQALGEYVEREDRIQALYDEQDANRLDLEHVKQTQQLSQRLRQARGAGAREEAETISRELEEYNSGLLGRARSPRARMLLENSVTRRSTAEVDRYQTYADDEFVQDFRATNDASLTAAVERANDIEDLGQSREALEADAFRLIEERAQFEGWSGGATGERAQEIRLRVTNSYHMNRARQIARGDPSAAMDYALANRQEMTDEAVSGLLDSLNNEAIEQRMTAIIDGAVDPQASANDDEPAPEPREETPIVYDWDVNSPVGRRSAPTRGASTNHAGTDYEVPTGTQIPVTLSGRVTFAGERGGYGNMVEVDHGNGVTTRYAHLSRINVRVGQSVSRGDMIAASGSTGRVTGPHLHYEIRRDGRPVSPNSIASTRVHPGGTRGGAVVGDVEQQVAAIRSNETLSWRERQVAESIVRRRHGQEVQARAFRENEADRAAALQVAEIGENFNSMSQLPNGGADLGPQDRLRYSRMAQANREAAESEPPSPDFMLWMNYTRYANPSAYASEQFLQEAARRGASAAMLRSIAADQGQILGTRIAADRGRIWSVANPILQAAGIDYERLTPGNNQEQSAAERQQDATRKNAILANLEQLYEIYAGANPGQAPPDNVIREWVSRSVLQAQTGTFSLLAEDDVSLVARLNPRDRARAEAALRSANIPITDQALAMAVRSRLALTRRAP